MLLTSCGDDPKPVRHDDAPPRPLTEDRCPRETRQLCDRVEAGEPAATVFHELNIAKAISKLSACVINCPGPYAKISNTILPAARKLEEKLEQERQSQIWRSPLGELTVELPHFFDLVTYRIVVNVEGRTLPLKSGYYPRDPIKYEIPTDARVIQACFDATPSATDRLSPPWWSCAYIGTGLQPLGFHNGQELKLLPVSELATQTEGSISAWKCIMAHRGDDQFYTDVTEPFRRSLRPSGGDDTDVLEIQKVPIYLMPGEYELACEVSVRRLEPARYRTSFSVPPESAHLKLRITERDSSNNPASIQVEPR